MNDTNFVFKFIILDKYQKKAISDVFVLPLWNPLLIRRKTSNS